ncbi:NTP transferase domain-containing protein [Comamonas piscis]|uniref:NTP transferase domain-containing protein n=1 Tax=Comamonas piscis TaxID=1562974 RepID=A0A7G5EGU6_9BURK|nr:NTP transferase domain-containing protein [Comamonas piscis]QMV73221.1 NTP transferase domain-containing protein [Comamonas piscis]WSO36013.1 NTP transferase domain-containing protein [Comamonas piscis]
MEYLEPSQLGLAACILAAGYGSRMGHVPKAAIRIRERSVLEWQVLALRGAGVQDISVVVGPYQEQLCPLVSLCEAELVLNESKSAEILHSQIAAVKSHYRDRHGCDMMVLLGDLPFLQTHHFLRLRKLWEMRNGDIHGLVPMADGVRGHPLVLSWSAVQTIAESGQTDKGIRSWLSRSKQSVQFVEMNDPAYVRDVDIPQDLAQIEGPAELPLVS